MKEYFVVKGLEKVLLDFYVFMEKNFRFVDEFGCIKVGDLILDLFGRNIKEKILVRVGVGGIELEVEVMDFFGYVFKLYCNFLF